MALSKKKIYVIGCTMWDIVGKPLEPMWQGKDSTGLIIERLGGVALNIALGLSKILDKSSYELNLVSVIGKNNKTRKIQAILRKNNIQTKYLIIKGNLTDQYLSIETKHGEIFGSINSSNTFLSNQNDIIKNISSICSAHKKENENAVLIFDGNCTKELLDYVKTATREEIFTKYFIPANFSKLTDFKNEIFYFKGFNLIVNLNEANILMGSKNLTNSEDAAKAIFKKIKSEKCLAIVTDGPNTVCGVTNGEVEILRPKVIRSNASRSGAGDAFFAYFLSYKELNPGVSLKKSLRVAIQKTLKSLQTND